MSFFSIAWRGLLMGLAEVVPGVSGGTMALITGIYEKLIASIATFGAKSLTLLTQPQAFFSYHQLGFLLPLVLGMVLGIVLFAQVMGFLLIHVKPVVWAFFFGVILASVWVIGRQRPRKYLASFGLIGLALALLVTQAAQGQLAATPMTFFFAGMLAVSAWILPAISGSYVLLILGLYEPVLAAVRNFEFVPMLSLAAGCGIGLALFVRLLKWLMQRWYEQLLALLTGFMLGSVVNLWPWQITAESNGERFATPAVYESAHNSDPLVVWVIVAVVLGSLFLWLIARQRV